MRSGLIGALAVGLGMMLAAAPADGQVRVRASVRVPPIGLRVAIGTAADRDGRYREDRGPVSYEPGMSVIELERYRAWVEAEYDYYRHLDDDDAWRLGWTERELDDYVDWLKEERKYLKRERKRLEKLDEAERRYRRDLEEAERRYGRDVERAERRYRDRIRDLEREREREHRRRGRWRDR